MASDAADFLIETQTCLDAVSWCLTCKLEDFLRISHSPTKTVDEVTQRWKWLDQQQVNPADAWFRAVLATTLQEVETILVFRGLEYDTKELESEMSRWARGDSSRDTVLPMMQAVAQDVRLIASRVGCHLLCHHCSRNGTEQEEDKVITEDESKDDDSPLQSDPEVVTQLKQLSQNTNQSLQANIKQTLQFFATTSNLDDEFNGKLEDYLGQLKIMEQMVDLVLRFQPTFRFLHHEGPSGCRSSVCFYVHTPRAELGRASTKVVGAWLNYHEDDQPSDDMQSLWKLTWYETFMAIERQHRDSQHTAASLRRLLEYNVLRDFEELTPKRKTRGQLIGMARARKKPTLLDPGKPKAGPSREPSEQTPTATAVEGKSNQITLTIRKPKPTASTSTTSHENSHHAAHHSNNSSWGWNTSPSLIKPSQFGDDSIRTPRTEAKQKTRGTLNPALVEEALEDLGLSDPEEEPDPATYTFTDPALYTLFREVFPLSAPERIRQNVPEPTGRITFTDMRRLLSSPPLSFREITIGMPECKWESPSGKGFSWHTPHKKHGGRIEGKLLKNLRESLRRAFGWTGEEFALVEAADGEETGE